MFTKDIGIDLGTANTLVYMKGRGIIMREPSVVAVDPRSDELRVRSVGHEAKAVIGRAPGSIVAVRPLKDGVIADFDITAAMLQSFIRQACGSTLLARPRVVICVPSGVTEVERRAVRQAAAKAGAALSHTQGYDIGVNMVREALSKDEDETNDDFGFKTMLLLAIATSIDALAVGVTFALEGTDIALAACLIGLTTFTLSPIGLLVGHRFGLRYKSKAELVGGLILVAMGVKILLEHLGVLGG